MSPLPTSPRVPLWHRLPEIYRNIDAEQNPPGQFEAFIGALDVVFDGLHESIGSLYHDFFIETCADWAVPYIGAQLGVTPLSGPPVPPRQAADPGWVERQLFLKTSESCDIPLVLDPMGGPARAFLRTLRADVADALILRRRKGTRTALEALAANLTGWAAQVVELRQNLGWMQHLNHQRPDAGGRPAFAGKTPVFPQGGTISIRNPASLAFLHTAFDPYARCADVKPAVDDALHFNLPNTAIFLWRLRPWRLPLIRPFVAYQKALAAPHTAKFAVGFDLDALSQPKPGVGQPAKERPLRLFNTWRVDPLADPPELSTPDEVPGPILRERLSSASATSHPAAYVSLDAYDPTSFDVDPNVLAFDGIEQADTGLQFFVDETALAAASGQWKFRGANLCAWERGLNVPLAAYEVVIDPEIGRVLFAVATAAERDSLVKDLLASVTYASPGELGAHPISRSGLPVPTTRISAFADPLALQKALGNLSTQAAPVVIEIADSLVHELDPEALAGLPAADGDRALCLGRSLTLRAATGQRPILRLRHPLRFRPTNVQAAALADQPNLDALNRQLAVRLEGLFITRSPDFPAGQPLIARAAVARLEILHCTLDPGGHRQRGRDPVSGQPRRAPVFPSLGLVAGFGFTKPAEKAAFPTVTDLVIQRCATGGLRADDGAAQISLKDTIVDAGAGVGDAGSTAWALAAATGPATGWAPGTKFDGVTCFGRVRVFEAGGQGVLFTHQVEVLQNQTGCLSFCAFPATPNRLPAHHACAENATFHFTSEWHGDPGYGQLARSSTRQVLAGGPHDDAMGAFGFLFEAHKWANLKARFREFMPVGVRPLLIPLT